MIVQSFRSVLWVGAVAGAAISCYMVSLRVAAERAALERVETQILVAKRDIRSLDTELTTRGRLRQLERWNSDVLALTAPTEGQFLESEVQLASLGRVDPKVMPGDGDADGERFMHAVAAPPPETQARPILADYTPAPSDARLIRASLARTADEKTRVKKTETLPAAKAKRAEPTKAKPKVARDDADARKPVKTAAARETAADKKRQTVTAKRRDAAVASKAVASKKVKAKTTT